MSEALDHQRILREALLEIRALREAQELAREPIAVIGLACRFPGADHPDAFWKLLIEGRDAVVEVPKDRWDAAAWHHPDPDAAGRIASRHGGFLPRIDEFDPGFFGISPREAAAMDPQQRLLLEIAWETLEHAGIPAERLRGGDVGVFTGLCFDDYARLTCADPQTIEPFGVLGTARSTAAGRIAYCLGVHGPVLQIDTACSASLAAVHLAMQSLRRGECSLALCGGVNLILDPTISVGFSRLKALAPDGRCKTFDGRADGYGRGEGCGMVALKPLRTALADGDTVLAVLRGSAMNHDGASNGLTAPNGQAQEALLRKALADAGLPPSDIDYVEAHGTGTALGDPIEVHALARVLGEGRTAPLLIGSVKTNIGHLEGAAGIAGLIKAVLALRAGALPPSLHFRTPNPHIRWTELPVEVVATARPWPDAGDRPRRAGVSAFGMSGTNVHVLVEEAPPSTPLVAAEGERTRHILALSARSDAALRAAAAALAERFAGGDAAPADLCHSANTGRDHFEWRAAVVGHDAEEFRAGLWAIAEAPLAANEVPAAPQVAFLFTGQGSQYVGMGRTLYETQPSFRSSLDECAAILDPLLDKPLLEVMFDGGEDIHSTLYAQPALFTLEYSLARLWQSFGVRPAAMLGHSVGEYVAACLAGVLNLEEALTLIAARGRLIQGLPAGGGMAAALAAEQRIEAKLARYPTLAIAAVNGPCHTVVSGDLAALRVLAEELDAERVACLPLKVSHAFHSPRMEPILAEFARLVAGVALRPPTLRVISNVTGAVAGEDIRRADYWVEHLRRPVRFADGLLTLAELGVDVFLEIGPHPTLAQLGRASLPDKLWLPSLRRETDAWEVMLNTLAELYRRGLPIDWRSFDRDHPRRRVALPSYPFQRRRYWLDGRGAPRPAALAAAPAGPGLYGLAWEALAEAPEAAPPPPASAIAERLGDVRHPDLDAYGVGLERLEALSFEYVAAAFRALGGLPPAGVPIRLDVWGRRLGLAERHARLFGRLMEMLGEAGCLRRTADGWVVARALPEVDPAATVAELRRDHPDLAAETDLVVRCGSELAEVLRGERDPLELLFPGGDAEPLARLYGESPAARVMNDLVARAVAAAVRDLPRGAPLRVLEVGAGTGATSAALLAVLPEGTEYWCTDLSNLFLKRARERFRQYPGLRTALLDLERPPEAQEFAERDFDIIVAANVLHATRDLRSSLDHARRLLRPSGLLLLIEGTARRGWLDISFGLTEGWWQCTDASLRPEHPLLSGEEWRKLLESCGFDQATTLAPPAPPLFQQALILARRGADPGDWLLLADWGGIAERLAARLGPERCVMVYPGAAFASVDRRAFQVDPRQPEDFRRLLETLDRPLAGAVHLWGLNAEAPTDAAALAESNDRLAGGALHLCQALAAQAARPLSLWLVTRGAQAVTRAEDLAPAQAILWGLGRAARAEHPELGCRLLDLGPADPAVEADRLAAWLLAPPPGNGLLALRDGRVHVPRLRRLDIPPAVPELSAEAGYLITGGLGGLGLATARWLAERGARRLYLVGRRVDSAAPPPEVEALRARGVEVTLCQADVSRFDELRRVFERTLEDGPLRGVVHAAGNFSDRLLREHRWALFQEVLAPKVLGAWNLHRLTRDLSLDFFLLYSSAASLLGAAGLANYIAANAFLDTLAHARRREGLPGLAINWGPWAGLGMSLRVGERREAQWAALGVAPLAEERALAELGRLLASDIAQAGVLDVDFVRYLRGGGDAERAPDFFAEVAESSAPAPTPSPAAPTAPAAAAPEMPSGMDWLRTQVAEVLGFAGPAAVPPRQGFFQLGMDSLTALELHKRLQTGLGRSLPSTLTFAHPTVEALAAFLFDPASAEARPESLSDPDPDPPAPVPSRDALAAELALLENLLAGTTP
jgi:acyl transferase domain-containing protein/SAM-dependent methyltransferase